MHNSRQILNLFREAGRLREQRDLVIEQSGSSAVLGKAPSLLVLWSVGLSSRAQEGRRPRRPQMSAPHTALDAPPQVQRTRSVGVGVGISRHPKYKSPSKYGVLGGNALGRGLSSPLDASTEILSLSGAEAPRSG